MSSLTAREKARLEKLFDMAGGYVLHFSDSTIATFFYDAVDIDIHDEKYCGNGRSKAKKLREFWRLENDYLVGKATQAMIEEAEEKLFSSSSFLTSVDREAEQERKQLIEPCKAIATRLLSGQVNLDHLKSTATTFDAKHLAEQIRRIESSINDDPALAIGTAKELIETCCKTILAERGKPVAGTPDIPTLTKATLKELNLVPEGINEQARGSDVIKRLLQNLGTIGNGLAELRGLYGTGHGKDGRATGLMARHAKLAVGAAATLTTFLFDTHKETP
ncbi:abortive infection family protein [Chryseolinea sp. H1M3-3]|uniref:abortive infection family protein n=1 Tax=Chryseolinea sp. H1M3-3 TaxID=3034144 RepID=UPI0023EC3917|nr:abortive infection family protein [Chryseolinea sp. H1M3-3]